MNWRPLSVMIVGDSVAADDVFPNEALDLVGRDGG